MNQARNQDIDIDINVKNNRAILIACMITAFITSFMSSALNLSVPSLEAYFVSNASTVSWVVAAYTLTVAALSLPIGKIADSKGRRMVFLAGVIGFSLFSFLSIFSKSIGMIIVFRVLQGSSAAMIFATQNAILISVFPHSVQGKMLGSSVAATYVGLTAGPVIGGMLNTYFSWKIIFLASSIVALTAFILSIFVVPKDRIETKNSGRPDYMGSLIYVIAVFMSLFGMSNITGATSAKIIFVAGIVFIVLFFMYESKAENPIMKVNMFTGSRTFTFSNVAALLNYGATFAISYTLSIYLQMVKGLPSNRAGLVLILMPAVQAILSPIMGSLSDRIRPGYLASFGMGLCAFALGIFSFVSENSSIAYIGAALIIAGTGFAMFSSPNNNAIMNCVEPKDYGITNSIIATMRNYGQSSGMAVINIITVLILGDGTLEAAKVGDIISMIHISFIVFSIICVSGIIFSLSRDN